MNNFLKRNLALVLAFVLPAVFIIIVVIVVYVPSWGLSTDYNFLYAVCDNGAGRFYSDSCRDYLQKYYSVTAGKLLTNQVEAETARIFLHDTGANVSREISLAEAGLLTLDGLLTSPDGVTVANKWERGAEFFPFFDSGNSAGYYLTKGKSRQKLHLVNDSERYYYYDNFRFLGWVLPGR